MGDKVGEGMGTGLAVAAGVALGVKVGLITGGAGGADDVPRAYQMRYFWLSESQMCAASRTNQTTCN